ncbi:MAG: septum formation initiator family protein [Gemmatimonadota bacterium]|nr:septum formation initiator family protein [Gemmatimonadota bacterium]
MGERVSRWTGRVVLAAICAGILHAALFGGMYDVSDIRALEHERDTLIDRIDRLVARTDSLVQRGDSLESVPAAIERVAREELGMIRDGELLVRFVPASEE